MSEHEPLPEIDIDALVRRQSSATAERIDPRPLFERIRVACPAAPRRLSRQLGARRSGSASGNGRGSRRPRRRVSSSRGAFPANSPRVGEGTDTGAQARQAHLLPIDRCYLVEVRRESSFAAELSPSAAGSLTRLWTRGDRFWVESVRPEQRWAWGRDEAGRFWIAFGPHTAVRMDAEEVPGWLNVYLRPPFSQRRTVARRRLRIASRLTRETKPGEAGVASTIRIHAPATLRITATAGHPKYRVRRPRDRCRDAGCAPDGRAGGSGTGSRSPRSPTPSGGDRCVGPRQIPARRSSDRPFRDLYTRPQTGCCKELLARWFGFSWPVCGGSSIFANQPK